MQRFVSRRAFAATALLLLALSGAYAAPPATAQPAARAGDPSGQPLLVIAGASGQTGRRVLEQAPAAGWRVRALTSDVERARRELGPAFALAEWREVDLREAAATREAVAGAQFLISAIGARVFEGPNSPQFVDYQGNVNLVDAAKAAGVRHFVLISSASAGSHRDQSQTPRLGNVLLWKTKAEEHLKASGLGYTIIGPGGLLNTPPRRTALRVLPRRDYVSTSVSRADVARVALDALANPDADGRSFALVAVDRAPDERWREELRALPRDAGPARTEPASLAQLAFLAGHWISDDGRSEEGWFGPRGGVMLGVGREILADGRARFEYLRIEQRADGGIVYVASPGGRGTTDFRLTTLEPNRAVFVRADDGFPKMLTYWREGARLRARADGRENGERKAREYSWTAKP